MPVNFEYIWLFIIYHSTFIIRYNYICQIFEMKIHPVLINAVADALIDIFQQGKYADKVVEQLLKSNSKWGSRDRAFIAETTYECVRWFRLYAKLRGSDFDIPNFTT